MSFFRSWACSSFTLSAFSASLVSFLVACRVAHGGWEIGVNHSQPEEDSRRRRRLSSHGRDHSSRVRSRAARAAGPETVVGLAVHPTWLVLFPLARRASSLVAFVCTPPNAVAVAVAQPCSQGVNNKGEGGACGRGRTSIRAE